MVSALCKSTHTVLTLHHCNKFAALWSTWDSVSTLLTGPCHSKCSTMPQKGTCRHCMQPSPAPNTVTGLAEAASLSWTGHLTASDSIWRPLWSSHRGTHLSLHFIFCLGKRLCVCLAGGGVSAGELASWRSGCGGAAGKGAGLVPAVALGAAAQRRCMSDCDTCATAAAGRTHPGVA